MTTDRPDDRQHVPPVTHHDIRARVRYRSVRDPAPGPDTDDARWVTASLTVGFTASRRPTPPRPWYDTVGGKTLYWGLLLATLLGVGLSATVVPIRIPGAVYLFGFLGASVSVFTGFARQFDAAGRPRLRVLSRTVAVLPLAAGLYLLAVALPGVPGELSALDPSTADAPVSAGDRIVAGLVFLSGIYVSATLRALGGLLDRLVGLSLRRPDGATDTTHSGE